MKWYYLKFIIYAILIYTVPSQGNQLLQFKPYYPTQRDIEVDFNKLRAIFGGDSINGKRSFQFIYDTNDISFIIKYRYSLPDELTETEKSKFSLITELYEGREVPVYYYKWGNIPQWVHSPDSQEDTSTEQSEQYASLPLEYTNTNPKNITIEDAVNNIKSKQIIILTGAGISAAANIYTVNQLWQKIGRKPALLVDQAVLDVLNNPKKPKNIILDFYRQARDTQPTPAHIALAQLALYKNCRIITGNFDRLHERSGTYPYRVFYEPIETISAYEWQKIDLIITVGSSFDFGNVLAQFRSKNPRGTILSINQEQSDYLSNHDYLLSGDIQQIIPAIMYKLLDNRQ